MTSAARAGLPGTANTRSLAISTTWKWAAAFARAQRPINYVMNQQLNAAKRADPLEGHLDELRAHQPPGTVIIGGEGDSRPAAALRRFDAQTQCEVVIIPGAGHHPSLEAPHQFGTTLRAAVQRHAHRP